jgi:Ca2+-transporting ATPase
VAAPPPTPTASLAAERPAGPVDPAPDPDAPAHARDGADVLAQLDVDPDTGLSPDEAARRRERFGPNVLAEEAGRPAWKAFLDQFRNFLIIILLVAGVVSFVVSGELKTPIVILAVVLLNAVLGFVQEQRAERSLEALRSMLTVRTRVRRGGDVVELDSTELVPGDVVLLEAGDRVPADARVLQAISVESEEAALTGESAPVAKSTEPVPADAPLGDRANTLFMNSTITRGQATAVVTATGMSTEIGHIAGLLRSTEAEPTPLQKQLDHVAHVLAGLAAVVVALVFAIGLLRGQSFSDLFLTAVALAVASVPEGLPAVLAVTLALGAHQMAKRNAIVKKLASVETLGCTSVICSDKTGTLTMNQMTARSLWLAGARYDVTGQGYRTDGAIEPREAGSSAPEMDQAMLALALCNDSEVRTAPSGEPEVVGDPTEAALTVLAAKAGLDLSELRRAHPRRVTVPFDSATKYMATLHDLVGADGAAVTRLIVKGAPDVLLDRCASVRLDGASRPLDTGTRGQLDAVNAELAGTGLRVLGLAWKDLDDEAAARLAELDPDARHDELAGLEFVSLIGILDPPRPEARDAIALCNKAGITVKMITGDHAVTASAIAAELGLRGGTLTGAELERMDDEALEQVIDDVAVFARVAPEHKLRLVRVLQRRDNVVAMTGDGVNDAPALKQADIGVAMGITGTEVSKEAATMILADDNFATIVDAVRRGRTIYDNIVKFVRFQLSTTIGFGITFLTATATTIAAGKPFTALQILWVNIIMDGPPAMALGVDPPASDTMQRRPRPVSEKILMPSRVARLVFLGLIMAVGSLGVMLTAPDFEMGAAVAGTVAGTMAFTTFVFFQFFNLMNCRAEHRTVFRRDMLTNGKLWAIIAVVALLQVAAVHVGFLQSLFDTTSLSAAQWGVSLAVASSIVWLEELRKLVARVVLRTRS